MLLVGWYYFRQQNAIVLTKKAVAMHTEKGSLRVVKVILTLKNRGSMSVNDIRVVDNMPRSVKAPTQYGSVRPIHVKASPEGTVMVWDVASVRAGQEFIITYRLEGNIDTHRLLLPSAKAKYTLFGRMVNTYSHSVQLTEKR